MRPEVKTTLKQIAAAAAVALAAVGAARGGNSLSPAGMESDVALVSSGCVMKVYLPSDYVSDRKWPVIFFYHGMGGSPETALMRRYTGGRGYIVVGMPYLEGDDQVRTLAEQQAYIRREWAAFGVARNWLMTQAAVDGSRIYLAGVSKGGWMVSALGEMGLAQVSGLIILVAGRPSFASREGPMAGLRAKPIYIGSGETDPNNLAARRAAEFYRRGGAHVTFEEYPGIGHDTPPDPELLRAWLERQGRCRQSAPTPDVREELTRRLANSLSLTTMATNDWARYRRLAALAEDPRLDLADPALAMRVAKQFQLERDRSPAREEWEAEQTLNNLLFRETRFSSLADMRSVLQGFVELARAFPETRCGGLAAQYAPGLADAYARSEAATRRANAGWAVEDRPAKSITPALDATDSARPAVPVRQGNKIIFKQPESR